MMKILAGSRLKASEETETAQTRTAVIITEGALEEVPIGAIAIIPGLDSCTGITIVKKDTSKICAHIVALPVGAQKSYKEIEERIMAIIHSNPKEVESVYIQTPKGGMTYVVDDNFSEPVDSDKLCNRIMEEAKKAGIVTVKKREYDGGAYVYIDNNNSLEIHDKASSEAKEKNYFSNRTIYEIREEQEKAKLLAPGDTMTLRF